jgi:hypothetical protein
MYYNDNDPAPPPGREPLKPGWYPAMVEEAADGEAKSSGKPRTSVTFKVAIPNGQGWTFRKVWQNYAWHVSEQKGALRKLVESCGIVPKGRIDPGLLVGRKVEIYVTIKVDPTGQYQDKNEVGNVRPVPGAPPPVEISEFEESPF